MRRAAVPLAVTLGLLLLAPPAVAKEGVRAFALRPVALDAKPGTKLRVVWRLRSEDGHTFRAGGIYLRIRRCSGRSMSVPAKTLRRGRYSAAFTVPAGGLRRLRVGLVGWRMTPGHRERADVFFPFAPPLERPCA
jgi:hypothetical protein